MSVKDRMTKINEVAANTRLIHQSNPFRSVWSVNSVRTGKPYQVTLEWCKDADGIATIKSSLFTFDVKEAAFNDGRPDNHPANHGKSPVCYQVLGVAKRMASESGKVLSLCENYEDAIRLSTVGQIVKIVKSSGIAQWAVVVNKPAKLHSVTPDEPQTKKMTLKARVNLLRGEIEEGID